MAKSNTHDSELQFSKATFQIECMNVLIIKSAYAVVYNALNYSNFLFTGME